MREEYWNLIAKHQANETTQEEELFIEFLVKSDDEFKTALADSKEIWSQIKEPQIDFDKERIQSLMNTELNKPSIGKSRSLLQRSLKYAAIFIGLLVGVSFIINDLNSTITISKNDINSNELTLPDGSKVYLNKDASITYNNSILRGFNRNISMNGEAFFEIKKADGNKFTVTTNNYDIVVLGTKFNVKESKEGTSVALVEGSIKLNSFDDKTFDETMIVPGQRAFYNINDNKLVVNNVNTMIYTAWMLKRLEFNNFSISDLVEVFKNNYNKTLVIEDKSISNIHLGGSAPSKDVNLILKGLSKVLKHEIIQQNDTIIIK